ncbi:MAG: beta-hydroxyacyl-ACP dehydratase [Bacteroidaceae bacterium]|nr:beta-hydroxyacyl-ACP dehydratase [Bacteroidaceae bacterium]
MKLQDNLFTIVSQHQEEESFVFQVRLHPEWPIYRAHFPGHPITPGVCIVQMVQELLQVRLHRELSLCQAKNIKYLSIVSPEEIAELTITFSKIEEQPDDSLKVQAQVTNGDLLCTKLSVTFK